MVSFSRLSLCVAIAASASTISNAETVRPQAQRLRNPDSTTVQSSSITDILPSYGKFFKSLAQNPLAALQQLAATKEEGDAQLDQEKDAFDAMVEALGGAAELMMSMPTDSPSDMPSSSPSISPAPATPVPSSAPTDPLPTVSPTDAPVTAAPTQGATSSPTLESCPGITQEQRVADILAILDAVADPVAIRNETTPQGLATTWILSEDELEVCPDYPKLVQRWAMAVIYYSAGGESWLKCSANPAANDNCGSELPFIGEDRFLSETNECEWAGISCINGCVTEIEFEENNLRGTIATEIGLLSDLKIWGMERGRLTSTIPTEIAKLTNLIFLDLDFNELTGTLSSELLSLSSLTQLDLNNNNLSGSIEGIGVYPDMEFLQLHDNFFTGTVPEAIGTYSNLSAFTLHESFISGSMPESVCDLLVTENNGGVLTTLIADCSLPDPNIVCDCCTDCRKAS